MTTATKKRLSRLETAFAEGGSRLAISARVTLLARALSLEELEALEAKCAGKPEATTLDQVLTPEEYTALQKKLTAAQ